MVAFGYKADFLRGKVGELLFKGSLVEVGTFVRPTEQVANFYLSLLIDEDIIRPHITYLTVDFGKVTGTAAKTIEQIPKFLFLEVLAHLDTIFDLLFEDIRVILVEDLYSFKGYLYRSDIPAKALAFVLMSVG